MVASPGEWSSFLPELSELTVIRESFPDFVLIYRQWDKNKKVDLLEKSTCGRKTTFFIGTFFPDWFHDTYIVFV